MLILKSKTAFIFFIILSIPFLARGLNCAEVKLREQELQHDAIAINIEVPVRVFAKGEFVEELDLEDSLKKELLDKTPKKVIVDQLKEKLKKDINSAAREFKGMLRDLEWLRTEIERDQSGSAAALASENYYLLYYTPMNYKSDGKFKKIKVRIKGKKYKVTHRAGYIAD